MSSLSPIQSRYLATNGRAKQQLQQHLHYDHTNSYRVEQSDEIVNEGLGLDCSIHDDPTTGSSIALLSGEASSVACPSHRSSCFISNRSNSLLRVSSDTIDYFDVSSPLSFCGEKKLTMATTPTSIYALPDRRDSNSQVSSPAPNVVQAIHEYNNNNNNVRSTRQNQYRPQLQQQQHDQQQPNKQIEPIPEQQRQRWIQQESKSIVIQQESKSTLMPTQSSISVFSPDTPSSASWNETGTTCALDYFFAGLRQQQSSQLQRNGSIRNHNNNNSYENDDVEAHHHLHTPLQFLIVSDGALLTAQPARKNVTMRCNGSTSKLNRWDSTGSLTNLLQTNGGSRRSYDTIPTLPGQRQLQVSEMKNSTWELRKDKLVAPTRTSSSSSTTTTTTTTTFNDALMLLGKATRHNQEQQQTHNIRSASSSSSFFQNSRQSITQTSSRFVRSDSNNDFAPSVPQRR